MTKTKAWSISTILLLLNFNVLACGNAMDVKRSPDLIPVIMACILFISPVAIPWLMGKTVFYIKKHMNASSDRRNLFFLAFTPWVPALCISTLVWFIITGFLLDTFWGYQYSTITSVEYLAVAYLLFTLLIYKLFNITPFRKK